MPDNPGFAIGLIPSAVSDVQDVIFTDNLFIQLRLEDLFFSPPQNFTVRLEMTFDVK
jgi:hypothetical protein